MKATFAVALAAVFVTFAYGTRRVHCPPENDVDVTLLPNPDDCTSYYSCNQGIAWPMYCPGALHFNAELRVCDLPEHAKCASSISTTSDTPASISTAAVENHRPSRPGSRPTPTGPRPTRPGSRPTPTGTRPTRPGSRPTPTGTRPTRPGSRPTPPGTRPPPTTVPPTTVPPTTVPSTTV
ncbi:salivary glue protein Sgs-3-like [Osmia bicornis bicornis]|uniref:salivary glue protein Sgs-3-like n=1 Tax=Osmia bicornis bicornis TaxID=1437191 RepID=UPI001EAF79BE|nr:salivary glue protein Sgs-3-like [Osmia bicornis bicornis]